MIRRKDNLGIQSNPGLNDSLYRGLGFLLVVAVSYLVLHHFIDGGLTASSTTNNSASSAAAPVANTYTTLSPATVPSKAAECSTAISFDAQGVPSPLTCADGDLNVQAWDSLATLEPTLLNLGYSATATQAQSAMCADVNATLSDANTKNSIVVEDTVYKIAALYYGWSFATDPTAALTNGSCS
jgi:hypothetical protein